MSPVYQVAKVHCVRAGNAGVLIERIAFRKIASCCRGCTGCCVSIYESVCERERERDRGGSKASYSATERPGASPVSMDQATVRSK